MASTNMLKVDNYHLSAIKLSFVVVSLHLLHECLPFLSGLGFALILMILSGILFFPIGLRLTTRQYEKYWLFSKRGYVSIIFGGSWFRIVKSVFFSIFWSFCFIIFIAEAEEYLLLSFIFLIPCYLFGLKIG